MLRNLYFLATAIGNPIHLVIAAMNKTRPSCARVKVQVDLAAKLPDFINLEVVNSKTQATRIQKIKIQYDMLSKYFHTCKIQGHEESEYRCLYPEMKKQINEVQEDEIIPEKKIILIQRIYVNGKIVLSRWNPTQRKFPVVRNTEGYLGAPIDNTTTSKTLPVTNTFKVLQEAQDASN